MGAVEGKPEDVSTKIHEQMKAAVPVKKEEKKKLKICCACPETKQQRDECMVLNGEEGCKELIELHKACLRREGFDIK